MVSHHGTGSKKLGGLKKSVLQVVKPTEEELKLATYHANRIMARLKAIAPKDVEIITAGSVARGTQVRGSYDIDIFLLFPKSKDERSMEARGLELGKKIVDRSRKESFVIKYAEHPYVKIFLAEDGITADIVPAFKIKNALEIGTAVDRTPLHNKFVNQHLKEKQKDDVRILKSFLKNHNIYGAEAKVRGFSGYLCELLTYYYGSFENTLESFSSIRLPLILNIGNKVEVDAKSTEGAALIKQFKSDFIILDPTDINRNVAASVSVRSIAKLAIISRALLANPEIGIFAGPRYSDILSKDKVTELQKIMDADVYVLAFNSDDILDDIVWEQLTRLRARINEVLTKNNFAALASFQNISGRSCIIALFINRVKNGSAIIKGPTAFMDKASNAFLKAHKKGLAFFLENERITSLENPKCVNPEELLREITRDKNFAMPSHIKPEKMFVYMNSYIPERYAKMLYEAFEQDRISVF